MDKQNALHSLIGSRAQTVDVETKAEMFELIGYIAKPGRISSIEAEIPTDGRNEAFESLFPGQVYRPITMGDTPSGLPNKISPQLRINFLNIDNCPEALAKNMRAGNSGCVGRINKSKFVLDLVMNYGFQFGKHQDVSKIRKIAQRNGLLNQFERGFNR